MEAGDIIRQILALPDEERHLLCDHLLAVVERELSAPEKIDENQNVCSSVEYVYNNTDNSILYATPKDSKEYIYNISYKDSSYIDSSATDQNQKKIEQDNNDTQSSGFAQKHRALAEEWMAIYNAECPSYHKAAQLTDLRIGKVAARSKRFTTEMFTQACRNMEASEWMRQRGFGNFDWIVKTDENLSKLAEDRYGKRRSTPVGVTIAGRQAFLVKQIEKAAAAFNAQAVDAVNLAIQLDAAIEADWYYKQLTRVDLEEIFRRGCARQYEYHGLSVATICGWLNGYKETFKELKRKGQRD